MNDINDSLFSSVYGNSLIFLVTFLSDYPGLIVYDDRRSCYYKFDENFKVFVYKSDDNLDSLWIYHDVLNEIYDECKLSD